MDWPGCDGCRAFRRLFNVDDPDYHLAGCAVKGAWDILVWLGVMICMADKLNQLGCKWFAVTTSALFTGIPWEITLTVSLIVYCYSHYFFAGSTPHVVAMYAAWQRLGCCRRTADDGSSVTGVRH